VPTPFTSVKAIYPETKNALISYFIVLLSHSTGYAINS
jgi:hypothetical protein